MRRSLKGLQRSFRALQNPRKFENRLLGPTILLKMSFRRTDRKSRGRCQQRYRPPSSTSRNSVFITRLATSWLPISYDRKINFARDLQERLGILALLALYAPFRICKLHIPLLNRETDPVSGHHLESLTFKSISPKPPSTGGFRIFAKHFIFSALRRSDTVGRKEAGVVHSGVVTF